MLKKTTIGISVVMATAVAAQAGMLVPKSTNHRYTVNYARSAEKFEPYNPHVNTVVNITNRATKPNDIAVAFFGLQGDMQCLAAGTVDAGQTRSFGTTVPTGMDEGEYEYTYSPFSWISFPAYRVADSTVSPPTTTQDICDYFEGRAEIYSKYSNLQVAPWLVVNGSPAAIPMQTKKQSSKGGH